MTSANVTHFIVTEIETDKVVGRYQQNILCKRTVDEDLAKHQPPYLFHLLVNHPDENEEDDFIYNGSLEEYLHEQQRKQAARKEFFKKWKERKNESN